eukprot:TRINITY_DN33301_c0_g1_i1.p1 TRINITY_DN33301_c0_g1~~TRINITY_DN33301_c0_g1_i1.p1  ORF type:complete len:283 (+),score=52.16 TRINITY_DN33301_c0_g1_i1:523-1371(+)
MRFLGSGFAYGSAGFVATCAHVFEGIPADAPPPLVVRFGDGRWLNASLWGTSTAADVAVVQVSAGGSASPKRPGFDLSTSRELPAQGDQVLVVGATQHGHEVIALTGLVSQPKQTFPELATADDRYFLQLAVTTLPGMSGSPVLSAQGDVVAMLAKKFEEHGLALPAARVAAVCRRLEAVRTWKPPVLGAELVVEGSVIEPQVVVRLVRPGTPAAAAGLQAGDEIVVVQGVPVKSIIDVREALALPQPLDASGEEPPVQLRLRRMVGSESQLVIARVTASRQ